MSTKSILRISLRSAATFGRGDGVPGLVDREVEHDAFGLPYLRGKTLKGLLAEECANLVALLEPGTAAGKWRARQEHLFGTGGSSLAGRGILHVGDAQLPASLRALVQSEIEKRRLTPQEVLESLTGIRRQTAMNEYGGTESGTLRAMRVIVRDTVFEAELTFEIEPSPEEWSLLAATVLALRRAGTGRNRGRGWLQAELGNEAERQTYFQLFAKEVAG